MIVKACIYFQNETLKKENVSEELCGKRETEQPSLDWYTEKRHPGRAPPPHQNLPYKKAGIIWTICQETPSNNCSFTTRNISHYSSPTYPITPSKLSKIVLQNSYCKRSP